MIKENDIFNLVNEFCKNENIFPVQVNIKKGNHILVLLDGEISVRIDDCVRVSKFIEGKLNRDEEDFQLDVSSFGIGNPLLLPRQYIKNINRSAMVTLNDKTVLNGIIVSADDNSFTLAMKVPPKKKETQNKEIKYSDCLKTQIIASFK